MNESMIYNWKVCVISWTYNHAHYIEDAMNGFCMQETNFPYVCAIVDDASSDGEQDIIKRYLADNFNLEDQSVVRDEETEDYFLNFAQHKINKNCFFAVLFLKYNHYKIGKYKAPYLQKWRDNSNYIALCEGDDYWIDSHKLQIQVSFLDEHPEFVLCFHDVKYIDVDRKLTKGNRGWLNRRHNLQSYQYEQEILFNKIVFGDVSIQTLSALYRVDSISHIPPSDVSFLMGDTPLWLDLSQVGKIKYHDKCMGVYNIHTGSSTHSPKSRLRFSLSMYEMRVYYYNKYNYSIPSKIKSLYNKTYFDYILVGCNDKPLDYKPMFDPFVRNIIERIYIGFILHNSIGRWLYRNIIFHISKKINWLSVHIKMIFKLIYNL